MKILKPHTYSDGRRTVTLELTAAEARSSYEILYIDHSVMYKLGHPIDDIVHGNHITEARPTIWCVIEQKWVD